MDTEAMLRRLSAGVSLIGLSIASSALGNGAGTSTTLPGAELPPEYTFESGHVVVSGVTTENSPTANAIVDSVPHGTFVQRVEGAHDETATTTTQVPLAGNSIEVFLENATSLSILAGATATPDMGFIVNAHAQIFDAISQIVTAPNTRLTATLINSDSLRIGSTATAKAADSGDGIASTARATLVGGLHQEATVEGGGNGTALVTGINDGSYAAFAEAQAASDSDSIAEATLREVVFLRAQGNGAGDATTVTTYTNNGELDFRASADSFSRHGNASSTASAGGGEHGLIHIRAASNGVGLDRANVGAVFADTASLEIASQATAEGALIVDAAAIADGAIVMKGQANGQDDGDIAISLINGGHLGITARASAISTGTTGSAAALASMSSAIVQTAEASGPEHFAGRTGMVSIFNTGDITMDGSSSAAAVGSASASTLFEAAILQESETIGFAGASFTSQGSVTISGTAAAQGASAEAFAFANGVEQELFGLGLGAGALASFVNDGDFTVAMTAEAAAGTGYGLADAQSHGYRVWGEPIVLDVANLGTMEITSAATANGPAYAGATGMAFLATWNPTIVLPEEEEGHGHGGSENENGHNGHGGSGEDEGPVIWEEDATNAVTGQARNAGIIFVSAAAKGVDLAADIHAVATGVDFQAAVINASFTNAGTIQADAATNGGVSEAIGIRVRDFALSPITPGAGDVLTIVNDGGSIIAHKSHDLGATWSHGMAIDTSLAPNAVAIHFGGDSHVYGDIDISADDTITVTSGGLVFDGVINPDEAFEGSLAAKAGATLYLTDSFTHNPDYDGPAGGYVQRFTLEDDATLGLELPVGFAAGVAPADVRQLAAIGTMGIHTPYPQILADTAAIGGTLLADIYSANGLYENEYFWDNIVDANTLTGAFAQVLTGSRSIFLEVLSV